MPTGFLNTAPAIALAGGLASALLYVSVLSGGFGALILVYLAPLPLFVSGLWFGFGAVAVAGAVAGGVVLLATGSPVATLGYAATGVLPALVVVRQALLARPAADGGIEWYPPGHLLIGLTGLGVAAFLVAVLLAAGEPGGLEELIRGMVREVAGLFGPEGEAPPPDEALGFASAMPGIMAASWLLMTIVNATLAQGLLMRFGRNRRPPMRLADLELPQWAPPAFAVAVLAAMVLPGTAGFVALNVAIILGLPFAFAGLSVVHVFAERQRSRTALLVGFYLFLFLFGWPIVLMVGLGVIEQWMGFRRRMRAAGPDQEDE
ncbi:DUF2232 domain-containing protein [Azospirillum halopraeferens]|uniref:DUF2232 domain-containing protein n=1 Tax=Azospirillum halopraeferens TaxID=34010 RepID=UPI00040FBBE1|nr:DUF2232 domain-containing protein [Azospirillum halopraeferens]